jgi:8-amino-7-oxononanoate synthase
MPALLDVAREELALIEWKSLARSIRETERLGGGRVRRGGREYVSFSCNDYLGLAHHPRVIAAAQQAIARYGAGAGASRLVTGSHPPYTILERLLAEFKGTERALVFGSGYLANLGVLPALVGKNDLLLADRLSHACSWDGARLSGATVMRFEHNRVEHCRNLLEEHRASFRRCLICTETVFSMDGDRAPVAELGALACGHDAWLMTDDAHGLGTCSAGTQEAKADLQMGTLSKATGSYGGYVCARAAVIALLENRARSLIFSTALPPACVAAAAAALQIMKEDEALLLKPLENARRFTEALGKEPANSPIVPVVLGEPRRALAAAEMLEAHGYLVVPIRPPSVPEGTARLRFAFSALHEPGPIKHAARLLKEHDFA